MSCCGCCGSGKASSDETNKMEEPLVHSREVDAATEVGTEYTYSQMMHNASNALTNTSSMMPSWTVFETVDKCWQCDAEFDQLGLMSAVDGIMNTVSGKMSSFFSSPGSSATSSPTDAAKNNNNDDGRMKRHHCRRCRNCFCERCASRREMILLLQPETPEGEMKPQRVCDHCFDDLRIENKYLSERHFLTDGQGFKKSAMMGMLSNLVTLRVNKDFNILLLKEGLDTTQKMSFDSDYDFEDEFDVDENKINNSNGGGSASNSAGARFVHLSQVDKVELKGLTSFDILFRDSGANKTWSFEGDTHSTASTWVWFLAEACRRARSPGLKTTVELQRKQRAEKERRADKERERFEAIENKRAERLAARDQVQRKYSHSTRR